MDDRIREEMQIIVICERMGWDFYTYKAQPRWFLKLIHDKYSIDAQKANEEKNKNQQQTKY